MQLRWSEEAANDLERITNYLLKETPQNAPEPVRAIYQAPSALLTFPRRGRPGKRRTRGNSFWLLCSTSWFIESRVMLSTFYAYFTGRRNGLSLFG
jgi:plasmid stabilization system protein ParE